MEIFITGGTGYIGARLTVRLLARGHHVRVLAREGSLGRVAAGAIGVAGNALDADSVAAGLKPGDTVIHLVGTPHPSPAKAKEFHQIDLPSIRATVEAVKRAASAHLIYVSVARPAPVMRVYQAVRAQGEAMIQEARLTATILRPWYVLGPGHRWPLALMPLYKVMELIPSTRESALRLGLVTLDQMVNTLARAVENPPPSGAVRIVEVAQIRAALPCVIEDE